MSYSRFKFLEKQWNDLFCIILNIEKLIEEKSDEVYKKLKKLIVETGNKVFKLEELDVNSICFVDNFKRCTHINEEIISLFNDIEKIDKKEFDEEFIVDIMNRLFRGMLWIIVSYSDFDYYNYDFSTCLPLILHPLICT